MRRATWTDTAGRKFVTLLPDHAPESDARKGVPLGPPDLGPLNLPLATEVRLNNQLAARGLLTEVDASTRLNEVAAALMAAYKADAQAVVALYQGPE